MLRAVLNWGFYAIPKNFLIEILLNISLSKKKKTSLLVGNSHLDKIIVFFQDQAKRQKNQRIKIICYNENGKFYPLSFLL